jgi:glycosyltransferase involved in cell wall biosynthesis
MNVSIRAEYLRSLGHSVDVIGPEALGADRFRGLAPLLAGPLLLLKGHLTRYDLVIFHSHLGWAFHLVRPLADRAGRVHSVIMLHGLEPLYHEVEEQVLARHGRRYSWRFRVLHRSVLNALLRFSCRRSHAILCLNSTERDWLVEHRWCHPENLAVVANGVEEEFLTTRGEERPARRLIFVANWLPRKGIREIVEAFTLLASNNPALELVCAGTGVSAEVVRSAFPADVAARVHVVSSADRSEILTLLRSADIFLFPSAFEGFSGALLEGMAAGLAVVATPVGAAPDLLEDGTNALVVPVGDPAALARAVQRLIDDIALRTTIGRAAAVRASSYTWPIVNAQCAAALMDAHTRPAPAGSFHRDDAS